MAEDNDAVQEFLAREQQELADLQDDQAAFGAFIDPSANQPADLFEGAEPSIDFPAGEFDSTPSFPAGEAVTNGFPEPNYTSQPTAPAVSVPRIEPEKIRRWREEQKVRLEKKDADEEKEKAKLLEQGKKELEDWYRNRAEQLEKTKKQNRIAEMEVIKERDADQPGQEWERITRLCEFNPKAGKNNKDVSRLRSILLQLKQTPLVRST